MLVIIVLYVITVALFRPFWYDGMKKWWSLFLALVPFLIMEYRLVLEAGSHVGLMIGYIVFAPIAVIIGEFVVDSF